MSSTQSQQQEKSQRPLRLLSLDAGGVRSLFTISILKRIMNDINAARATKEKLEPWEVFDMIGGAENGGLIAIMLGRLRMSLDDCEVTFRELCEKIYQPKDPNDKRRDPESHHYKPSKFDSGLLTKTVKDMICKHIPEDEHPEEALLKDLDTSCKVAVNPGLANELYETCKLWEACAATIASEGLFDPMKIMKGPEQGLSRLVKMTKGSEEGLYYSHSAWDDPMHLVGCNLKEQWPGRDALLISIGSGIHAYRPLTYGADAVFEKNPDLVRAEMRFRFNHDTMLRDVLREDSDKLDHILESATAYMDDEKVKGEFQACIGKLCQTFQVNNAASHH